MAPTITAVDLRIMECSLQASFSCSAFECELGVAGSTHQRVPHPFAQLRKARLTQRFTRARGGEIDGNCLMDARGASLKDDHTMAEQHRLFDRVCDEDHRGR